MWPAADETIVDSSEKRANWTGDVLIWLSFWANAIL